MESNILSDRNDSGIDNSSTSGLSTNSSINNTINSSGIAIGGDGGGCSGGGNSVNCQSKSNNSESTSAAIDLSYHPDDEDSLDLFRNQENSRIKRNSSDSGGSTYEIVDPPSGDEQSTSSNRTYPKLELEIHTGSRQSTTKTSEERNECDEEERDTFSPISNGDCSEQRILNSSNSGSRNSGGSGPGNSNNDFTPTSIESSSSDAHEYNLPLSPLTAATVSGVAGLTAELDNKIIDKNKTIQVSSKEQKQRQNEEIVQIMETSSISSETGSWESVFPHRNTNSNIAVAVTTSNNTQIEVKDCCHNFLESERKISEQLSTLYYSTQRSDRNPSTSKACFIDASTLLDESEVNEFLNNSAILLPPKLPEIGCFSQKPPEQNLCLLGIEENTTSNDDNVVSPERNSKSEEISTSLTQDSSWGKKMHLDKLETFYKSFEKCKNRKPVAGSSEAANALNNSDSSSSSSISPTRKPVEPNSTKVREENNLSDEEKLWKRQVKSSRPEIKDQYNKESPTDAQITVKMFNVVSDVKSTTKNYPQKSLNQCYNDGPIESKAKSSIIHVNGKNPALEEEHQRIRNQDQERKQGNIVFQNNIQQFSTHTLQPKIPFTESSALMLDYSSAPSLAWSDLETGQHSNYSSDFSSDSRPCELDGRVDANTRYIRLSETRPPNNENHSRINVILPDTPHNSIVQIERRKSPKSATADTSLTYFEELENIHGIEIPKKPSNRFDDLAPIVSGGASIKDFTPQQCESPPVQRKTDSCPIVSGGFISLDFQQDDELELAKKRQEKLKTKKNTWVVDMSDCKTLRRRQSTSSNSSVETRDSLNSLGRSLGFYVSLNDMESPTSLDETQVQRKMSKSYHENNLKKATGFYVDFSENENSRNSTPPPSEYSHTPPVINNEKKNIFSMFIDIGETNNKLVNKKEPLSLASRLSSSLLHQKGPNSDDSMKNSTSSQETLMSASHDRNMFSNSEKLDSAGETMVGSSDESHKPSLQSVENSESPAVVRRTSLLKKSSEENKRHSWNISSEHQEKSKEHHKRSASLIVTSADDKNIMNILDKLPLISKTSSMSIDSPLSPYDDISKSEFSPYSNNSGNSGCNDIDQKQLKKRRKDVKINETFDKSSQGSLTDGVLSKELSPSTDTDDLTFQQDDQQSPVIVATAQITGASLNNRPVIMETIIEAKETASPKKISNIKPHSSHTMETLHATMEKQKMLLETVNENSETSNNNNFVRLSDMDKPISHKFELHSPEALMSKSVGNQRHINRLFGGQQRPHSWAMTRSTGNSIANITNSVENIRSLSRLFPHLSKEFSNSLPNDVYSPCSDHQLNTGVIMQQHNRSPNELLDFINTDELSNESSLASSFSRSAMDESSISCRQPRRLGEDLLKMFLQEIGTDVVVEVNGRRIKAHKCILRSRCQYFAAMLAGGWVQSAGNVISLQGYSYSSVHFALCHIYSGACHPPDGISLMELAALADLLGLEGLKEVTAHALKLNYCHNFHKPCSGCIDGILQVLPVALNHALDDLYRKCLKWTCKHYLKVWPTRAFAQLPSEIFSRCRQLVVAHLTSETVLESILECDNLLAQLVHCRWAIVVENLVRDILDLAYGYVSDHFASLIASDSFLSLGHDKSENITRLENILLRTASTLNPDQACRSYQRVTRLNTVLAAKVIKVPASSNGAITNEIIIQDHEEEMEWNEEFIRLVSAVLSAVEQCLTRQCARAMRVSSWQRMDLELRKKIQKLACLTEPLDHLRSRNSNGNTRSGGITSVRQQISFSSRNQDLYQVKLAIQAHSKKTLAQDTQLYRPQVINHHQDRNTQTTERGIQAINENNSGKIMKSTSRTYVPNISAKSKSITNEKPAGSINKYGHRRTHSEDTSISNSKKVLEASTTSSVASTTRTQKPITQRLAEIKPRYLEPRKPRSESLGPLKSQTLANITNANKGKHISSSDSSRTSSPATGRRLKNHSGGKKSINMSLDSLASPSKRVNNPLKSRLHTETEISVDSLAESMRSSVRTDKTISQESLGGGIAIISNNNNSNNNKNNNNNNNKKFITRSNPSLNNNQCSTTNNLSMKHIQVKKTGPSQLQPPQSQIKLSQKAYQQNISTGSSPSSIATTTTTNKSSRLSSVSSVAAASSPRDAFKNRVMISNPNLVKKHSFLSAKSREILAKRAEKINQQSQQQQYHRQHQQQPSIEFKSMGANIKSKITSNIPQRTIAPPSTLQLKKRSLPAQNFLNNGIKMNQPKSVAQVNKSQPIDKGRKNDNKKKTNEIEKDIKIESKLERSSTFCKDSSDLPVSELQIIE